jgi:pyruvate kinase
MIRSINERNTAIQFCGFTRPKLRVGVMNEGVIVNDGDLILLTAEVLWYRGRFSNIKNFPNDVNAENVYY